ncbi:MAG: hypothetical protein JSR82_02720 [Verrucomicrobia bacterium]|nr:hypothetical protein [Verrucomicrobiota bacterium]
MNQPQPHFEDSPRSTPRPSRPSLALARRLLALLLLLLPLSAPGQAVTLANPNWNITLTDFGYSDFLLDNTPGFEGREYLSGEWGAAVAYTVGGNAVAPTWLEPNFSFPNWTTNSNFTVVSPITQTGVNADNLPIAQSVVSNGDLQITLRFEMIDTVVGTPIGVTPASGALSATPLSSNRYVMKQTATIRNVSGATISGLQFFQLLHGLTSQRGVFDDRAYPGTFGQFRYDATLAGVDPYSAGTSSSSQGLEDYISLQALTAPSAFEIGAYGLEGNGVDDHASAKPSDGVHLSIEDNWTNAPYSTRRGTEAFQPPTRWVAGAQRWELGTLAPNQTATIDLLLAIRTGTSVTTGGGSSGGCNGGSGVQGGLDYDFEHVETPGSCFGSYSHADENELQIRVANGEFAPLTFPTPAGPVQVWKVEFNGAYTGGVTLKFHYDATQLPPGFDETSLTLYHYESGAWQQLTATVDPVLNTIAVTTTTFGTFALGLGGALPTFSIDATTLPAAGGTVGGTGTYPQGAGVVLTATPEPGFGFVNWTENGSAVSTSATLSFNAAANRALVANFLALGDGRAITTSSSPANAGTTTGGGVFPQNTSVTVTATAEPGYKFSKWTLNGVTVSTSKNYTFTVTTDAPLVAKFKPVFVVNVDLQPSNGGDIGGDGTYSPGDLAKLRARPNHGWSFVEWTENGTTVGTAESYDFTVTANRSLVATFALGNRIDASPLPKNAGSVSGGGVYPNGAAVTLVAEPKFGYVFTNWTENGVVIATTPDLTFASSVSRVVEANFVALPSVAPTTTVSAGEVTFRWPAGATHWLLQESSALTGGAWIDSTRPVTVSGTDNLVTAPTTGGNVFFRLVYVNPAARPVLAGLPNLRPNGVPQRATKPTHAVRPLSRVPSGNAAPTGQTPSRAGQ